MFTKYRELSLSLIPLKPSTKAPIMVEWSRYCEALPTEEEAELWDRLWKNGLQNVGLCLGSASGIVAVDVDSDERVLLDLAPPSPVRKRGATGETRFFRYDREITLQHLTALDILTTGAQTVLPPSIHPDTKKAYEWLTPDTLENFDAADLPKLTLEWVPRYIEIAEKLYPEKIKGGGGIGGRNNWLKDVVWAKRAAGEAEAEIVDAVYGMDISKNHPRLFTDSKEGFKANNESDARMNAWRFVSSVTSSFIRKKAGPLPTLHSLDVSRVLGVPEKKVIPPPPMPGGVLGLLYELCWKMGHRDQPAIALGGAIAIASVVLANRYRFGELWPNVYVLNVAPTGSGKSFPQKIGKRILTQEMGKEDLFGYGNYRSSVAIIKGLDRKRERLDMLDEASSFFMTISEGGAFQKDMDDTLCTLYSSSNDLYVSPEAAGRDSIRVWSPCLSILFSTTPQGLKESISRSIATKGFFPRCLPFIDHDYGKQKDPVFDEARFNEVVAAFRAIRKMTLAPHPKSDLVNEIPNPVNIPCSLAAENMLHKANFQWNEDLEHHSMAELERVILTRAGEQARKLALIHGAFNGGRIEAEDAEWAIRLVDSLRKSAMLLLPQVAAENRGHANLERVLFIITKSGALSHKELIGKTRFLGKRERNEILEALAEEGLIAKQQDAKGAIWVSISA